MGRWLRELKQNLGDDIVIHVVGTKADIVAEDPSRRAIPFERCIAYVAENLYTPQSQLPATSGGGSSWNSGGGGRETRDTGGMASPQSNRSSGFWGQDAGWDCCHEVSAKDGEGVEEVFRVITRKLVEQRNKKWEEEQRLLTLAGQTPGINGHITGMNGYFDYPGHDGNGSFRVGVGDKRRSWLGFPTTPAIGGSGGVSQEWEGDIERIQKKRGGKCC
jgi:hypothetical protein